MATLKPTTAGPPAADEAYERPFGKHPRAGRLGAASISGAVDGFRAGPYWEQAFREQDPELVHGEAKRVRAAVQKSLGTAPAATLDVNGLRQLVREWGEAWLVCVGQLPTGWAVQ